GDIGAGREVAARPFGACPETRCSVRHRARTNLLKVGANAPLPVIAFCTPVHGRPHPDPSHVFSFPISNETPLSKGERKSRKKPMVHFWPPVRPGADCSLRSKNQKLH